MLTPDNVHVTKLDGLSCFLHFIYKISGEKDAGEWTRLDNKIRVKYGRFTREGWLSCKPAFVCRRGFGQTKAGFKAVGLVLNAKKAEGFILSLFSPHL